MATKKQRWARYRNFCIFRLRGMQGQVRGMMVDSPQMLRATLHLLDHQISAVLQEFERHKTYSDWIQKGGDFYG